MVVELLTFEVEPAERDEWLRIEESVWSRFLERQPGFVRKEMWMGPDDSSAVHAVIWWESMASWKAIGPDTVAEVDEQMGEWLRVATCQALEVLRQS